MNNEKKANEIIDSNYYVTIAEKNAAYNASLQMAQWKDDKFYAILACVKYSLDKQGFNGEQFVEDMKKQWEDD